MYHSNIMASKTRQADKTLELTRKAGILHPWDLDTFRIYDYVDRDVPMLARNARKTLARISYDWIQH